MGRPRKNTPEKEKELASQIEKLAAINCQWKEVSAVLDQDVDYLRKRFSDRFAKGREMGKMSLRRKMFDTAMGGNCIMQIFLSKQMLGYSDKIEQKQENSHILVLTAKDKQDLVNKTDQELLETYKKLAGQ